MKTIDKIINDSGYTIKELKECVNKGICNGMGGKGGIPITKILILLPQFKSKKMLKLINDLDLISDIHDKEFHEGKTFIDFIKANYKLANNSRRLLHWTKLRFIFSPMILLGTTLLGYKYFKNK